VVATFAADGVAITFERLGRQHFDLLGRWLAEPHVARWWNHDPSPQAIEADFGDTIDGVEAAKDFVALVDGEPIGVIQFCFFHDFPEYVAEMAEVYPVDIDAATIDYLIGEPDLVGKGVGTEMIRAFVSRIWIDEPAVGHVVVPVNSANVASWRALLKAGFRLVARGDLEPDNPIDDPLHEILRIDRPTAAPDAPVAPGVRVGSRSDGRPGA
jgi:aminoglycoside 6'-N-acetyltransferase